MLMASWLGWPVGAALVLGTVPALWF